VTHHCPSSHMASTHSKGKLGWGSRFLWSFLSSNKDSLMDRSQDPMSPLLDQVPTLGSVPNSLKFRQNPPSLISNPISQSQHWYLTTLTHLQQLWQAV
jgi:hypothetical protein